MFGLGTSELLIIFALVLVIFGPKKLPELGRSLGRGLRAFKKGMNEIESEATDVTEKLEDKDHATTATRDHQKQGRKDGGSGSGA